MQYVHRPLILPAVVDVRFEELEYSMNERAADNQYVALSVCLKHIDVDHFIIPNPNSFTVTISTRGGTALGK